MPRTGAIANDPNSNVDEQQLASIGATRGPDGWWYRNGQRLSHAEADRLVREAGTAQSGLQDWGSGRGTLAEMYGRNRGWLQPVLTGAAGLVNPALGAAVGAGLNYEQNHNLGQSALAGGLSYAGGRLAQGMMGGGGAGNGMTMQGLGFGDLVGQGGQQAAQGGIRGAMGNIGNAMANSGLTWGDILRTGGSVAQGIAQHASGEADRRQRENQFNQTLGMQAGDRAVGLDERIQSAPLRDRAMYMAMNRAMPTPFQPRDFTRSGMGIMNAQAQGGPAQQMQANAQSAANYRPGAGGINTSTLEALRRRMLQQAGV